MAPINSLEFFRKSYCVLTGHAESFPWQEELFLRFCKCDIPKEVNLPTGCGKTSAMVAWLLALACQAQAGPECVSLPRRLVWVVNRRVVVDQATTEAAMLKLLLKKEGPRELDPVREALKNLSAMNTDDLVAISTLRGQFADNAEWRNDPARPAVVVGTVDMVGSRLLFAGYGRGFKSRPLHAGFLGQDALLIHDEAHLEPAFQELVVAIEAEQERCGEFRRLRVMALTATSRGRNGSQFTLTATDREHKEIKDRIEAVKGLAFHPVDDEKKLAEEVYRRALDFKDSERAILVFLRRVKDVEDVTAKLQKVKPVQRLTGILRGYERDLLAKKDDVFARFTPEPSVTPRDGTVYLVCTSAGEVGINISADHLVCDLTPFDSMAQRLGRVNRFGKGKARVEIVHVLGDQTSKKKAEEFKFGQACLRTLALLQKLPQRSDGRYDGSPAALGDLSAEDRQAAFTPPPTILATSDILFDTWALTSIREKLPGRPPVADWLHGITGWEPPRTYVAWRQEVEVITPELQEIYKPGDLLEDYPLKPQELLGDTTSRVSEHIEVITGRCPESAAWLVESDGSVRAVKLTELVSHNQQKKQASDLADCTVLLPPNVGGLDKGMLNGSARFDDTRLYDVGDQWFDEKNRPRRCRVWDTDPPPSGMRLVRAIDTYSPSDDESNEEEQTPTRRCWRWYVRPRSADDDGSRTAREDQELDPHNHAAQVFARELTSKLHLRDLEASAIVLAAGWHDLGKRRRLWQLLIGNRGYPQRILAKSGHNVMSGRSGYRHEFGSLIEISRLAEFLRQQPDVQDLVLHLVAAHHGRARPHFPSDEAFDPEYGQEIAVEMARETPRRFARLQRKYGRWGLAYLESMVRAADALASQDTRPDQREPSEVAQ